MSIFRTDTPAYRGQGNPPAQPSRTIADWFRSLFQVETPPYRTRPASTPRGEPGPDESDDTGPDVSDSRE